MGRLVAPTPGLASEAAQKLLIPTTDALQKSCQCARIATAVAMNKNTTDCDLIRVYHRLYPHCQSFLDQDFWISSHASKLDRIGWSWTAVPVLTNEQLEIQTTSAGARRSSVEALPAKRQSRSKAAGKPKFDHSGNANQPTNQPWQMGHPSTPNHWPPTKHGW